MKYVLTKKGGNTVDVLKISGKKRGISKSVNIEVYVTKGSFDSLQLDLFDIVILSIVLDNGSSKQIAVGAVIDYNFTNGVYKISIGSMKVLLGRRSIYFYVDSSKYTNVSTLLNDIHTQYLSGLIDGISADSISNKMSGWFSGNVADFLDELASLNDAVWWVDYDTSSDQIVLYFKSKANAVIDNSSITLDNSSAKFDEWRIDVGKYTEKVVVYGGLVSNKVEKFIGDGTKTDFTLTYLAKNIKSVEVNGQLMVEGVDYNVSRNYQTWKTTITFLGGPVPKPDYYDVATSYEGVYKYVRKITIFIPANSSIGGGAQVTNPRFLVLINKQLLVNAVDTENYTDVKFVKSDGSTIYSSAFLGEFGENVGFLVRLDGESIDAEAGDVTLTLFMVYGKDNDTTDYTVSDIANTYDKFTNFDASKWDGYAFLAVGNNVANTSGLSGTLSVGQDDADMSWSVTADTSNGKMNVSVSATIYGASTGGDTAFASFELYTTKLNVGGYKYVFYKSKGEWKYIRVGNNSNILFDKIAFSVSKGSNNTDGSGSWVDVFEDGVYYIERWVDGDGNDVVKIKIGDEYPLTKYNVVVVYDYIPRQVAGFGNIEMSYFSSETDDAYLYNLANALYNNYKNVYKYGEAITSIKFIVNNGLDVGHKININDVVHNESGEYIISEIIFDNTKIRIKLVSDIISGMDLAAWATEIEKSLRRKMTY